MIELLQVWKMASVIKERTTNDDGGTNLVATDTNYSLLFSDLDQKSEDDSAGHSDHRDSEQVARQKRHQSCYGCADITVTVLAVVMVWVLMALPTILYIVRH